MKIKGYGLSSHVSRTAFVFMPDTELESGEHLQCEGEVDVLQAYIDYDKKPAGLPRPYLRLIGAVNSVQGNFPHGITTVAFDSDEATRPAVEFRYDFTDDELSELVKKGLYDPAFKCPDIFTESLYDFPVTCNHRVIGPNDEREVPLVFVGVDKPYNQSITSESSGYNLVQYFEAVPQNRRAPLYENKYEAAMFVDFDKASKVNLSRNKTRVLSPNASRNTNVDLVAEDLDNRIAQRLEERRLQDEKTVADAAALKERLASYASAEPKNDIPIVSEVVSEPSEPARELVSELDATEDGKTSEASTAPPEAPEAPDTDKEDDDDVFQHIPLLQNALDRESDDESKENQIG